MSHSTKILIVDDLATQRMTIEAALADLEEDIVSVGSGREALKFLLDHDVAVILLDVNMPEMDGFETAGLIRKRHRTANTPIIFLTADTDELMAARGYALGAVDYLFCPFPPDVLRTKVKVFVSLSRAKDQMRREAQQQIVLTREQTARTAAEEQGRRLHVLVEAGDVLARSHDGSPFETDLLRQLVPVLADQAGLVVLDQGLGAGSATWIDARGMESADVPPTLAAPLSRVLTAGKAEWIQRADGDFGAVALPLSSRGEIYGALALQMWESGRYYVEEDSEIIDLMCSRIASALHTRRLYRELQERDRRKDEFLAMLSHELRNPLGAITTATALLEASNVDPEIALRARQIIGRQSGILARMVDDLLEVSRVTAGRIAVRRAPMVLIDVVERAVEALRSAGQLDRREVAVTGERVLVEADAGRMEQVMTNLLVNAVKYTDTGGKISIQVGVEEDHAVVRVADDGIGINAELLPHLFDVFVQGRQSLDRARGGLGIGLALVQKLVVLQGGTIEATSPGEGEGSTFIVRLPKIEKASSIGNHTPAPRMAVPPLRVLLVEDNAEAREMLHVLLEMAGHVVYEAADGPQAIERAIEVRPEVVLVDLGLPGFDGFEVARRLRSDLNGHRFSIIAVTGYGQDEDRRRTAESGFDAHLVKPVMVERLDAVLAAAARQRSEPVGIE